VGLAPTNASGNSEKLLEVWQILCKPTTTDKGPQGPKYID
jgi:hypothetical protein